MHQIPIIPVEAFEGFAGIFKKTDDAQSGIVCMSTNVLGVGENLTASKPVDHVGVVGEINARLT